MVRAIEADIDERRIDAIFEEVIQPHLPGAVVGISMGGRDVYRKGFGRAHQESSAALSPQTKIRIASITKQFTCLAFLLLCEEGRASIDDPIGKHVPEVNPVAHGVTARELMAHIGGLRDVHDVSWIFSGTQLHASSEQLLDQYRRITDVNSSASTTFSYNNGGYLIISTMIERISGLSLEEFLRVRIFKPLGMSNTELVRLDAGLSEEVAARHMRTADGGYQKAQLHTASAGEGGIVSTLDDMMSWLAHMENPFVGTAATWRAIRASQSVRNGLATGYGLGMFTGTHNGHAVLFHGGGLPGLSTYVVAAPKARLSVVVLANRDDVNSAVLAHQILDASLPGHAQPKHESETTRPVTGSFQSPSTGRYLRLFESDGMQMASIDAVDLLMPAGADGVLRPERTYDWVKWSVTARQGQRNVVFTHYGNEDVLDAIDPADAKDEEKIIGIYRGNSVGVNVEIEREASGIGMRCTGPLGVAHYRLEAEAKHIWRAVGTGAVPAGGIVTFDADRDLIRFSSSRTKNVFLARVP